jgi:hypothetical protein
MKKTVLKFGLIGGLISLPWFLVLALSGEACYTKPYAIYVGYASIILSFSLIFFGVRSYRANVSGGYLSFGKALGIGLLIALVACLVYAITWTIIYKTMMPDFYAKYAEAMEAMTKQSGQAPEMNPETMKKLFGNPVLLFLMTMSEPLPVGIIISLISALVLMKKNKNGAEKSVAA